MRWGTVIVSCGIACALGVAACFFLTLPKDRTKAPNHSQVRLLVKDLGNVDPQSQTRCDIAIRNDSPFAWTVGHIRGDCSCTVYGMQPTTIEPGAIGTLSLEYGAGETAGAIDRKLIVLFREKQAPTFICHVTGFVEPWCYAMPKEVDFGRLWLLKRR